MHPSRAAAESLALELLVHAEAGSGLHEDASSVLSSLADPWPALLLARWRPDQPGSLASAAALAAASVTARCRGDLSTALLADRLGRLVGATGRDRWRRELLSRCAVVASPGLERVGFEVVSSCTSAPEGLDGQVRRVVGVFATDVLFGHDPFVAASAACAVIDEIVDDLAAAVPADLPPWSGPRGALSARRALALSLVAAVEAHDSQVQDPASAAVWLVELDVAGSRLPDGDPSLAPLTAELLAAFPWELRDDHILAAMPRVCAQAVALVEPRTRCGPPRG